MNFLKKLGTIIANISGIVSGIGPLFSPTVPKVGQVASVVSNDLEQIAGIIVLTQAIGEAAAVPGAQKLIGAAGPVAQVILQSSLLAGKKIDNPDLFKSGATKIADGIVDVLKSIHADAAKVTQPQDVKAA